jgi:hypothetical protein
MLRNAVHRARSGNSCVGLKKEVFLDLSINIREKQKCLNNEKNSFQLHGGLVGQTP